MFKKTLLGRVLSYRTIATALMVVFASAAFTGGISLFNRGTVYAATNSTINFQARLQTAAGGVVPDGNYFVEFNLYNVSTGGTSLWTERYQGSAYTCPNGTSTGATNTKVTVQNGYISVNLGALCNFPTTINWDQNLYLTMNVGGSGATATWDGEMTPRLALTAVPYAFKANQLAQANSAGTFTSTLSLLQPTVGNQAFQVLDQGAAGTYNLCVQGATVAAGGCAPTTGGTGYIQNQNSAQQATSNFWISGTGRADTALQAPSFDSPTAVALNIGTTNATSITLGKAGVNTFVGGNLSVGTTQSSGAITIANGGWITSTDASGTGTVSMFSVNSNNQIQVGAALSMDGGITLPTNGGQLTLVDMGVDANAAAGTKESYTLAVGATNALTVYGESDGAGNTQNVRVAVGSSITPAYTLDVGGDINISSGSVYRINGQQICSATGCTVASGSSNYIQNNSSATAQTANFNIQSAASTSIAAIIQGASGQSVDIFEVKYNGGAANAFKVQSNGVVATIGDINTGGNVYATTAGAVVSGNKLYTAGIVSHNSGTGTTLNFGASSPVTIQNSAATTDITSVIKLGSSQTGDLLQFQDSNSNVLTRVTAAGRIGVNSTAASSELSVTADSASTIATIIKAATNQTADLQQFQNVNGNVLSGFTANGAIYSNGTANIFAGLTYPSGVTVTTAGTSGSTTYGYRVSAINAQGETIASPTATVATGNASLSTSNYNVITFNAVPGAASYKIYGRTSGSELYMNTVFGNGASTYTYNDQGTVTPSGALPTGSGFGPGLQIKGGNSSGSNSLFTVTNNASATVLTVNSGSGQLGVNASAAIGNSSSNTVSALQVTNSLGTTVGGYVQGATSQTADLFQFRDNFGTVSSGVTSNGSFYSYGTNNAIYGLGTPTITSSSTGTTYYYEVSAYVANASGVASAPVGMANNTSTITWTSVAGARGYNIYRSSSLSFTGNNFIGTATGTSFTDTGAAGTTGTPATSFSGTTFTVQGWDGQTNALNVLKAGVGQTGDLLQFKNSAGTTIAKFDVSGNLTAGSGTFTATSGTVGLTVQGAGSGDIADFKRSSDGLVVAAIDSTGNLGSKTSQFGSGWSFGTSTAVTSITANNGNASSTAASVDGLRVIPIGAINNNANANTINGINLQNVATITNNTFNAIKVGTGYDNILNYNGTQLISGAGKLQNAALDSTLQYTNITGTGALTSGSIASGFGTIITTANIQTSAVVQGGYVNTVNNYQVGGTAVIDSSRNLTNIGTITAAGLIQGSGSASISGGASTVALTVQGASGQDIAQFKSSGAAVVAKIDASGNLTTNNLNVNGSTINNTLALGNFATGGAIGTAAATVDAYTVITINQTTSGQTLTIPTPTNAAAGHVLYISNIGSTSFTLLSAPLNTGATATLVWNGSAWTFSGADASSILNQNSTTQTGTFNISGSATAGSFSTAGNITTSAGTLTVSGTGNSSIMGALGLGTNNPQTGSALTVQNGAWISSLDSTGSGYVNMFSVNSNNQIQVGAALSVDGGIQLPTNGGQLTLVDMGIDSTASAGTKEGYTLRVGSSNALTVYGEADGSGNAQNVRVAIGSSIAPAYTLDVGGDINIASGSVLRIGGTQICSSGGCTGGGSGTYVNLQSATPGTADTGNINVSGKIIAGSGLQGSSLDTAAAGQLSFGATNATSILLNQNTSLASGKTFTLAGAFTMQPASDSTSVFNIKSSTAGNNGNVFTVDTTNGRVGINLGGSTVPTLAGAGLQIQGSLRLTGGGTAGISDTFTTPVGSSVATRINIPIYDPGASGQIIAFGLSSSANTTARAISVFDARAGTHQPTLGVFSVDESDILGFSWDGSSSIANVKTITGSIRLLAGTNGDAYIDTSAAGHTVNVGTSTASTVQIGNNSSATNVYGTLAVGTGQVASGNNAGTTFSVQGQKGGASTTNTSNGGTGGIANIQGGDGGNAVNGVGGVGGNVTIAAGRGGDVTGTGTGGVGGNLVLSAGSGGSQTGSGTAGAGGSVIVKNSFNSTTAFQIQNASSSSLFTVDSSTSNITIGASQFTNNGSTVFTTLALGNFATGSIGSAATTVDIATNINIAETSSSQTLTIPSPTVTTTKGRLIYVGNIGTSTFTISNTSVVLAPNNTTTLIWNGTQWSSAGIDSSGSNYIQNTTTAQTGANFNIGANGTIGGVLGVGTTASTGIAIKVIATSSQTGLSVANTATNSSSINIMTLQGQSSRGFTYNAAGTAAIVVGSNQTTANAFEIQNSSAVAMTRFNSNGDLQIGFATGTNSTTALQVVRNNAGVAANVFTVDTTNNQVTVGGALSTGSLSTSGAITVNAGGTMSITSTSTTAFVVQDASSNTLLTADTSTKTLTIGNSTNGVIFSAGTYEPILKGTAQHQRSIVLTPEYAGGVLDASNDSTCSSASNGTMTSGFDLTNRRNYYSWTSTQATSQCYDVVVMLQLPTDFNGWAAAPVIENYTSNATNAKQAFEIRDTNGTVDPNFNFTDATPPAGSWFNTTMSTQTGTYGAGGNMTIRIRMTSTSSAITNLGNLKFTYYSKY